MTRSRERLLLLCLVSVGAVLGSLARYALGRAVPGLPTTLAINVTGSFLLGLLVALRPEGRWSRPFLGTGVLGGFTTFSTFAVQTVDAAVPTGALYVASTVVLGVGAAALGLRAGRRGAR
ncbi:MAG: fluoride efflux transporter FluC [Mycobacteriales bacterium]